MAANKILLGTDEERAIHAEYLNTADSTILPGTWLERTSTGAVRKHAVAGGYSQHMVAKEDYLQGKNKTDAYAVSTLVLIAMPMPGTRFQAILLAGENVGIGDQLISDGAGRMKAETGTPEEIACWAEEALDLSASGAVDTLIAVRCG